MSLSNLRGDTPLHNAARWNRPVLVNELLLYGASYTATNNKDRTPGDLTSDDQVLDLIRQAMSGRLAVESYSPLTHSHNRIEHSKQPSHHNSSSAHTPNHYRDENHSGRLVQSVLPTQSDRTASTDSSSSKSGSFEYVQAPDLEKEDKGKMIAPSTGVKDADITSCEVIEGSEHEMSTTGTEKELWSGGKEDEVLEGEDEGLLSCDEEHRTLTGQEGDSKAQDYSPEREPVGKPSTDSASQDTILGVDNSSQSESAGYSASSNTLMLETGASGSDSSVTALYEQTNSAGRSYSLGDTKLIGLLHAIEAFDR